MIVMEGDSAEAALQAAHALNIPVLTLHKHEDTSGLFTVHLHSESPICVQGDARTIESRSRASDVLVLHTSGTSGAKKLVPCTLDTLCIGCGCIIKSWNLGPEDINLNMMPLFHIGTSFAYICISTSAAV
jgi:long-subunit acyl-CoA synthetase (AMP-forming)